MKNLLNLSILISALKFCSVTPDFKFADIEEQIDYAGAIIQGTVTAVSNQFDAVVTLNNLKYFRGCQVGNSIKIAKFVQSATCGNGIPKIGDQIIVFACENNQNEANLKLNQFVPFTGWVENNIENLQKVQQRTGSNGSQNCSCRRGIEKCLNRDTADECVATLTLPPNLTGTVNAPQTLDPVYGRIVSQTEEGSTLNLTGTTQPIQKQDPIYGRTVPELEDFSLNLTGTTRPIELKDPVYERTVPQMQVPNNRRQNRVEIQQPIRGGRPMVPPRAPIFEIRMPQNN